MSLMYMARPTEEEKETLGVESLRDDSLVGMNGAVINPKVEKSSEYYCLFCENPPSETEQSQTNLIAYVAKNDTNALQMLKMTLVYLEASQINKGRDDVLRDCAVEGGKQDAHEMYFDYKALFKRFIPKEHHPEFHQASLAPGQ